MDTSMKSEYDPFTMKNKEGKFAPWLRSAEIAKLKKKIKANERKINKKSKNKTGGGSDGKMKKVMKQMYQNLPVKKGRMKKK